MTPTRESRSPPLSTLLSQSLLALIGETEAGGRGTRQPSLATWAALLRPIGEQGKKGVAERDVPRLVRLSKRMTRTGLGRAARLGLVLMPAAGTGADLRRADAPADSERWRGRGVLD